MIEWSSHWDEQKPIWIEKSPPNIIRTRFLQELFPEAYFITIIRHPLAVSLATQKWSKTSVDSLINHWITAHRIYQEDRLKLKNEFFFSYEHMVLNPRELINDIESFLGSEIPYSKQFVSANDKYFKNWSEIKFWELNKRKMKKKCIKNYESSVNAFGYSLKDLGIYP